MKTTVLYWFCLTAIIASLFSVWNLSFADVSSAYEPPVDPHGGDSVILPIPLSVPIDTRKAELGKRLFEDKDLSKNGKFSCRSCHYLERGGEDDEKLSPSIGGDRRFRNTPSIFNVGLLGLMGWDGMPTSLEDLSEAIIKSKKGLATDWPELLAKLKQNPTYVKTFSEEYPNGIQAQNVKHAIAEYMRSLITPNARFDRYLRGQADAISDQEKEGYRLFKRYGCSSCHQGVAVGANMVAPINLFKGYLAPEHTEARLELGRAKKTKNLSDRHLFRVPSLRNVELTAPYYHDGSIAKLEEAVDSMARYMLGKEVPTSDRDLIVKFLRTLTGTFEGRPL